MVLPDIFIEHDKPEAMYEQGRASTPRASSRPCSAPSAAKRTAWRSPRSLSAADWDAMSFGIIELSLVFGAALGLGIWQLVAVRRELKRDRDKRDSSGDP